MIEYVHIVMGRFAVDGATTVIKAFASEERAQRHAENITKPYEPDDEYYAHPSSAEMLGITSVWIDRIRVEK